MEIEAKFRVEDPAMFTGLMRLRAIGPFSFTPMLKAEAQRNTYFDTPDRRLRALHYGLRVRDTGSCRIATLKGAGVYHDGLYEREEWEAEIGADNQPASWPPGETRDRTIALLDGAQVEPILMIRTLRHHINALRAETPFAQLSLDSGTIEAGGLEQDFCEVEIELTDERARSDFDLLVELLRERFSLLPEPRSKLARGLELLDQCAHTSSGPHE